MKSFLRSLGLTLGQLLCVLALTFGLYIAYGLSQVGLAGLMIGLDPLEPLLALMSLFGLATVLLVSAGCILALWRIFCLLQSVRCRPFCREDGRTVLRWLGVIAAALLPLVLVRADALLLYGGAAVADVIFIIVLVQLIRRHKAEKQSPTEAAP